MSDATVAITMEQDNNIRIKVHTLHRARSCLLSNPVTAKCENRFSWLERRYHVRRHNFHCICFLRFYFNSFSTFGHFFKIKIVVVYRFQFYKQHGRFHQSVNLLNKKDYKTFSTFLFLP